MIFTTLTKIIQIAQNLYMVSVLDMVNVFVANVSVHLHGQKNPVIAKKVNE